MSDRQSCRSWQQDPIFMQVSGTSHADIMQAATKTDTVLDMQSDEGCDTPAIPAERLEMVPNHRRCLRLRGLGSADLERQWVPSRKAQSHQAGQAASIYARAILSGILIGPLVWRRYSCKQGVLEWIWDLVCDYEKIRRPCKFRATVWKK